MEIFLEGHFGWPYGKCNDSYYHTFHTKDGVKFTAIFSEEARDNFIIDNSILAVIKGEMTNSALYQNALIVENVYYTGEKKNVHR